MKENSNSNLAVPILCGVIIMMSMVILWSQYRDAKACKRTNRDQYFGERSDGRLIPSQSLDKADISNEMVFSWAKLALQDSLTFDYKTHREHSSLTKKKYSREGWAAFKDWLHDKGIIERIEQNSSTVYGIAKENIIIVSQGVHQYRKARIYEWKLHVPVEITTISETKDVASENIILELVISRGRSRGLTFGSIHGISISDWREITYEKEQGLSDESK